MAEYHYDEAGNMAAYFLISFLFIILVPMTFSMLSSKQKPTIVGCQCQPCIDHRNWMHKQDKGTLLKPKFAKKTSFICLGWIVFAFLAYKASTVKVDAKVYNPFEVLGLSSSVTEKEIKSHYKKLSKKFHPDKVKLTGNETIESAASKFVDLTKAYKSLTDQTIRSNYEKYGHPDGRQPVTMGIALPVWVIEGKNNVWVLGLYGIIFGAALPALVGRWWFGNRQKTKDGVNAETAATFFKTLQEHWSLDEVMGLLGKGFAHELPRTTGHEKELDALEGAVRKNLGDKWEPLTRIVDFKNYPGRKAVVLLYAHLLRLPVEHASLINDQLDLLLQTPNVMNSLLTISLARNWLSPSLAAMRLTAHLSQALPLSTKTGRETDQGYLKFAQLPGIQLDEATSFKHLRGVGDLAKVLEESSDKRAPEVRKAIHKWGNIQFVDASFKVIGERIITPLAFVFLVVKLRISAQTLTLLDVQTEMDPAIQKEVDPRDQEFLLIKKDAEALSSDNTGDAWAHAPHWPLNRKPSWWLVLADVRSNRVVVPPMKITDVPYTDTDYRSYKLGFQAPQNVGLYTWRIYLISDTYVGEDVHQDIALQVDDFSVLGADAQGVDDDISDPEEDSLAGQMAALRGGSVKKIDDDDEDSDESDTDGDNGHDSSSDSD